MKAIQLQKADGVAVSLCNDELDALHRAFEVVSSTKEPHKIMELDTNPSVAPRLLYVVLLGASSNNFNIIKL